jgi:hypothetical protein
MGTDIVERGGELLARERTAMPHHFAAKAKAAIDRADIDRLEQHAIGIAVHDALDRAMGAVADGIGHLLRADLELGRIRNELARDRVARVGRVDQAGDVSCQRQGIARGDRFDPGTVLA